MIYFHFDFIGINTLTKMRRHKKYVFKIFSFPYLDRNICMGLYIVNNSVPGGWIATSEQLGPKPKY